MGIATFGGPMFESAHGEIWRSSFAKTGAHYNIFNCSEANGMAGLRAMFPDGEANDLNVCLFSTSGVHGTYQTIEDAEKEKEPGASVTFLIIQPRIVCMRYGNCLPETTDDFAFLKKLRASSWKALATIGAK